MPCGYNDNFIKYTKKLNLETMKNMSIDNIVRLYQQGYRIESMQYSTYCTGSISLDKSILDVSSNSANPNIYTAYAQKVKPTSKCLKNVILKLTKILSDSDVYVEIRPHNTSTGFPQGNPQTSGALGSYRIPISTIPTSATDITVPLDLLLSDTNITDGIWIVVSLWIYDPSIPDSTVHVKVGNGISGTTNEHMAFKDNGLDWQGSNTWNLYFKTNKQTYSAPPVLTAITISPTTASINIAGTKQLSATCKDQNNNTMTCPTLTWNSSNTSVATANSSGLVTGASAGTANITASAGGVTSNISAIAVTGTTAVLTSIQISPATTTIVPGSTKQFTVTCKDQNTNPMVCPTLIWNNTNNTVGTIGTGGLFTAIAEGTTSITASGGGKTSNTATVTVSTTPPPVAGAGGGMAIAAMAALALGYILLKPKPKIKR